ncbi:MAG TPA: FAD:protein FMN transferase [Vicinamibacterales bacterium]
MRRMFQRGSVFLLSIAIMSIAACRDRQLPDPGRSRMVERVGVAMGSELHLTASTSDDAAARATFDAVFAEFERLEAQMSNWRPGSDVLRINAAAGEQPVAVAPEVREVLHIARQVSEWTDGAFDVTFGALTDVWKFDQDQDDTVPDQAAIARRLALVDYRAIEIDDRAGTVFLARKGMRIHLGGIGKGYAVDRAVRIFRDRGLRDFMIQAGGDMYVGGQRDGRPWRLGIADPRGTHQPFATVDLSDSTFSTSGDYERFFIKDGVRYHHILDLRTGQPARASRSVTMVTDRAVIADALAKGVFILGPTAGMAMVERLPHVDAVIVSAKNEVTISNGLQGRVTIRTAPTDAP